MSFVTWDTETTIASYMKRKASPFLPENWVVATGWAVGDGPCEGIHFGLTKKPFDWFTRMLKDDVKILVGQNIKFDLLWALREPQNLAAWKKYVARGGNIWDIQLAEYLLRGMSQDAQMLSMDEMAPMYGGNLKIDEVKALWEAGVNTPDIDPDLLMRYLVGTPTDHGDIGNTRVVFKGQLEKARKSKQLKSILLNMGSLICTTEMERNGMFVNKDKGLLLAGELRERLEKATHELGTYLPEDLPFDFNWRNRYHLSPLLFGGQVKYEKRVKVLDEQGQLVYFQKKETHYILEDGTTTAIPPTDETGHLYVRFAGGKNKGELKTKQVTVPDIERGPKERKETFAYTFPGYTTPDERWASSTPGLFSVAEEVIESLGNRNVPFLQLLAEVAKVGKDLTTYYISTDPKTGEEKGMLTLVGIDSIIHHKINHTSTVTARFSSSDPNLQNVPKEGKSVIKTVFESRFGSDGQIVQSDFTSLEVYIQALLTQCRQLIADLKDGLDMHCVRVSQKEGVTYEEALLKCKGDDSKGIPADPVWAKKRQAAKEFSFQRAYGAGADKIAETTGMSVEDVKALIAAENERYPELEQYNADKMIRVRKSRRPTPVVTPHPEIPGVMCQLGKGFSVTPDNKVYSYRESPSPKWLMKRGGVAPQGFSPTEIANYEVQGGGGEWAKAAMWLAVRLYYANDNWNDLALLVNQVHDALYGDSHKDVLQDSSAALHACMLEASTFMEWYFDWKVECPVPSVTVHGDNMMEENKFGGDEWHGLVAKHRAFIRANYINNHIPFCEKH